MIPDQVSRAVVAVEWATNSLIEILEAKGNQERMSGFGGTVKDDLIISRKRLDEAREHLSELLYGPTT